MIHDIYKPRYTLYRKKHFVQYNFLYLIRLFSTKRKGIGNLGIFYFWYMNRYSRNVSKDIPTEFFKQKSDITVIESFVIEKIVILRFSFFNRK